MIVVEGLIAEALSMQVCGTIQNNTCSKTGEDVMSRYNETISPPTLLHIR